MNRQRRVSSLQAGSFGLLLAFELLCQAQPAVNQDESKVPTYSLPDPLVCIDGSRVTTASQWQKKRRPELLRIYEEQVYGHAPGKPRGMKFETTSIVTNAFNGLATRKEITIWFTGKKDSPSMDLLVYTPNAERKPAPAFLGLSFGGNHAVTPERDVKLSTRWIRQSKGSCVTNNRPTEACRGSEATRWQIEKVLRRGYAVATAFYGDLEADFPEGWKLGTQESIRAALNPAGTNAVFQPNEWGAIGAWAWGLSRALDYLETDRAVDAKRVAVLGHSRLGKTSLWAGAQDKRFAIVISNNSGEGGAAIARRRFGERTYHLNKNFPHWFCGNFKKYSERENELPVDAHELIALIAPRPVYVASATEDLWADPLGEFLAAKNAEPVYGLFGKAGLGVEQRPAADHPVGKFIGYHLRTGAHDVMEYDWDQYLNFADQHFKH